MESVIKPLSLLFFGEMLLAFQAFKIVAYTVLAERKFRLDSRPSDRIGSVGTFCSRSPTYSNILGRFSSRQIHKIRLFSRADCRINMRSDADCGLSVRSGDHDD